MKRLIFSMLVLHAICCFSQADGKIQDPDLFLKSRFNETAIKEGIEFARVTDYKGNIIPLYLDIYQAKDDDSKSRPVILWIHGGGFRTGSSRTQNYIVRYCRDFALRGFVCISIDYRLRESKDMPDRRSEFPALKDAARDANTALDWIRKNYRELKISRDLIFIAGGSAGGRTAITAAQFPGPDNDAVTGPENRYRRKRWDKEGIIAAASLWGAPEPEMREWVYPYLTEKSIPVVLIHGEADSTINVKNSIDLDAAMKKAGATSDLHILKGAPHTPVGVKTDPLIEEWVAGFFVKEWKNILEIRRDH